MDQDRIKKYANQIRRGRAKPKAFNRGLAHVEAGAYPISAFAKDILSFVSAKDYYADREAARQIIKDELEWLAQNGYLYATLVDGARVKKQLCYVPTAKLLQVEHEL